MKRNVLTVSLPVLVCLLCVCLVAEAVAAPPVPGPTRGRKPAGPVVANVNAAPDLVVQKVTLEELLGGEFPEIRLVVTIKNIGNKQSGVCMASVSLTRNIEEPPGANRPLMTQYASVPKLNPNFSAHVKFTFKGGGEWSSGMCIVAVDTPVAGKRHGQVSEWGGISIASTSWQGNTKIGEHNNGFAFSYLFDATTLPFTWKNPAVP